MMMTIRLIVAALVLGASASLYADVKPLKNDAKPDVILEALHAVGKDLKSLTAKVSMLELGMVDGAMVERKGSVTLQNVEDSQRALVVFDTVVRDERMTKEKREYLLQGRYLLERDYLAKVEVEREILRKGQKLDLLKLGEGPFPLPLGQPVEDVKRQFTPSKAELDDDSPEHAVGVKLTPKKGSQFAQKLAHMIVWVNPKTHLPVRVDTLDINKQTFRSTELSDMQLNAKLKDDAFKLKSIDNEKGWNRRKEPLQGK